MRGAGDGVFEGVRAASTAARRHSCWRESDTTGGAARRRPAMGFPLVAVVLGSMVLPSAAQDVPLYNNVSKVLTLLGTTWMGSGYDNTGDAHYLFRPKDDMTGALALLCNLVLAAICTSHLASVVAFA